MAKQPTQRPATRQPDSAGGSTGAVPIMGVGDTFREIGVTGLRAFSGWVREEFLPQLVGRQAATVYREMQDNSPTVGAILFAITGVMRKVAWRTHAPDDSAGSQQYVEFVDSLREDCSHTWDEFVAEALSMLTYGYAPHEICYKRRNGPRQYRDKRPNSNFNDGLIGWDKLPLRGQDTVLKWYFDENGKVLGYQQQPWVGSLLDIPMEKSLLFRPNSHKGNPEGRSILRNSFVSYYMVKRLQELESVLYERFSGFPVAKVPMSLIEAATANPPDGNALALYNAIKRAVTNVRINEQMGLVLPSDVYRTDTGGGTAPMYSFELITPQGGRQNMDADTPITRYKLDILTSVLADFIQLGHEQRGTQSLAVTKVDLFMQATEGWLNSIAAVINRYALPRLWALNGFPPETMPTMVPDLAQRIDLDVLSNFILRLSQSGMPLFPDADLETFIRDSAGMPDISEEGEAMRQMAIDAQQEQQQADLKVTLASAQPKPAPGDTKKRDEFKAAIASAILKRQKHIGGSAS